MNETRNTAHRGLGLRKRLALGAVGAVALGGLGVGLGIAHAAPPTAPPAQSVPTDAPTPGDTADAPGTADTPEPGDTPDAAEANEAQDQAEGTDAGPDVQQTGEHTDPGDLPGSK